MEKLSWKRLFVVVVFRRGGITVLASREGLVKAFAGTCPWLECVW